MGALDARDAVVKAPTEMPREIVSFDIASELAIIPIVGNSCSGSVGMVDTSAHCILIAPSNVTCCEET